MTETLDKMWNKLIFMCGIIDRTEEEQNQIDCMENYIHIMSENINKKRRANSLQNEK